MALIDSFLATDKKPALFENERDSQAHQLRWAERKTLNLLLEIRKKQQALEIGGKFTEAKEYIRFIINYANITRDLDGVRLRCMRRSLFAYKKQEKYVLALILLVCYSATIIGVRHFLRLNFYDIAIISISSFAVMLMFCMVVWQINKRAT